MEKCAKHGCVVVPVEVYSGYNEQYNTAPDLLVGVFYTPMPVSDSVIISDLGWTVYVDDFTAGESGFYKTPEEALEAYIRYDFME